MKKIGLIVLSVVLVLGFSALLLADNAAGGKMGMGKGMEMSGDMGMCMGMACCMDGKYMVGPKMVLAMAAELNLTPDQMEKLKKLSGEMQEKDMNMDEMQKDRDSMNMELEKDGPDESKINDMMSKMMEKHQAMMKDKIHNSLTVRAVLTKDQWEKLKKKMDEKKETGKGKWNEKKGK
jgi:Spy/CpxP family protein refolding chaperone